MRILLGILIFVLLPALAQADFYKWEDDAGKMHYVDSIAKVPAQYRNQVQFKNTPEPPPLTKKQKIEKYFDALIAEKEKEIKESNRKIREIEVEMELNREGDRRFQEAIKNKHR